MCNHAGNRLFFTQNSFSHDSLNLHARLWWYHFKARYHAYLLFDCNSCTLTGSVFTLHSGKMFHYYISITSTFFKDWSLKHLRFKNSFFVWFLKNFFLQFLWLDFFPHPHHTPRDKQLKNGWELLHMRSFLFTNLLTQVCQTPFRVYRGSRWSPAFLFGPRKKHICGLLMVFMWMIITICVTKD